MSLIEEVGCESSRVLHESTVGAEVSLLMVKVCCSMIEASCYYRYYSGDYITHLTEGVLFCFYFCEDLERYIMF